MEERKKLDVELEEDASVTCDIGETSNFYSNSALLTIFLIQCFDIILIQYCKLFEFRKVHAFWTFHVTVGYRHTWIKRDKR